MADINQDIILRAENLAIGYRNHVLHENISFGAKQGELFAILGINGSGKSTLLRTLAGLQRSINGRILVNNAPLEKSTMHDLALQVSIVFSTSRNSLPDMTVYEILKLGRYPYTNLMEKLQDDDVAAIDNAIGLISLHDIADKHIYELSDGEFQKVMIGRALVQDTPVILLDEPTSHLDIFNKMAIFKLLKSLAENEKKAIIFATHEIESALQISDQCLLLNKENKWMVGNPYEFINQGMIDQFFAMDGIIFNAETMRFDTGI